MRRLLSALINFKCCMWISIVLRLLLAEPHRRLLGLAKPVELYLPGDGILGEMYVTLPVLVSCCHILIAQRFWDGVTVGERIAGIRIVTKWKIWHALLEGLSVIAWPFSLFWFWVFDRLPADCLPETEIRYTASAPAGFSKRVKRMKMAAAKASAALVPVMVVLLLGTRPELMKMSPAALWEDMQYRRYNEADTLCPHIPWMVRDWYMASYLADTYTGCVELESHMVWTVYLPLQAADALEQMYFSMAEEGENVVSIIIDRNDIRLRMIEDSLGTLIGNDFDQNVLAISFGRQIKAARIQPGYITLLSEEDRTIYQMPVASLRFLMEEKEWTHTMFLYRIPRVAVNSIREGYVGSVRWPNVHASAYLAVLQCDEYGYRAEMQQTWPDYSGIGERWVWAFRCAVERLEADREIKAQGYGGML